MTNFLTDPNIFANAQRVARAFAESDLVPEHLRGKMPDCLVALHLANQMGEDPLMVMQSIYQVGGKPGWNTAFMINRANKSGRFIDPIDWEIEGEGKNAKVTAVAQLRRSDGSPGRVVRSPTVDMKMAQADGWARNKKYETMPELMFRYRSATLLIRLYAPEVLYGFHTVDELETIKDVTPPKPTIEDFRPGASLKKQVIEASPEPPADEARNVGGAGEAGAEDASPADAPEGMALPEHSVSGQPGAVNEMFVSRDGGGTRGAMTEQTSAQTPPAPERRPQRKSSDLPPAEGALPLDDGVPSDYARMLHNLHINTTEAGVDKFLELNARDIARLTAKQQRDLSMAAHDKKEWFRQQKGKHDPA